MNAFRYRSKIYGESRLEQCKGGEGGGGGQEVNVTSEKKSKS